MKRLDMSNVHDNLRHIVELQQHVDTILAYGDDHDGATDALLKMKVWFKTLTPDQKSECMVYMVGRLTNAYSNRSK